MLFHIVSLLLSTQLQAAEPIRIVVAGNATINKLQPLKAAMEQSAGAPVEVTVNPRESAIDGLARGIVDGFIGLPAAEAFAAAEKKGVAKQNIDDYESFELSAFKLVLGVHPENPITSLTKDQISGLLSGKIKTWESVNGQKIPVTIGYAKNYPAVNTEMYRFYTGADSPTTGQEVLDKNGIIGLIKRDKGALAILPGADKSADFSPKWITTEAAFRSHLTIKKKARPEVKKVFEFLKANRDKLN